MLPEIHSSLAGLEILFAPGPRIGILGYVGASFGLMALFILFNTQGIHTFPFLKSRQGRHHLAQDASPGFKNDPIFQVPLGTTDWLPKIVECFLQPAMIGYFNIIKRELRKLL